MKDSNIDRLIDECYSSSLSTEEFFSLIEEAINHRSKFPRKISIQYPNKTGLLNEKVEMIAGVRVKDNKEPVNAGSIAEGVFVLGLLSAMRNGRADAGEIISIIDGYRKKVRGNTLEIAVPGTAIPHFASQFDKGAKVEAKIIIKLDQSQMAGLFVPLMDLPDRIEDISDVHTPLLTYMENIVSSNNTDWPQLANIIMNPEFSAEERQKALSNLKNTKYDRLKDDLAQTTDSAAAFWNARGVGKRGYVDFVNDVLQQPDPLDTNKKLKEVGATVYIVADGVSENITTTADAFITVGDMDSGEKLFSYSLKKGSKQIFQTGGPGSELKQAGETATKGGGIQLIFVRFGLSADAMPKEALEFYKEYGAKPNQQQHDDAVAGNRQVVQAHVEMWNKVSDAFVQTIGKNLSGERGAPGGERTPRDRYEVVMVGGLAIMITKTLDELDMEYVDLGKSAETTIRAFPGLLPNYVRHFDFSSFTGGGEILGNLEGVDGFRANQPVVKIEKSYPVTKENLEKGEYVVKLEEIRNNLSRSPDYLENILDKQSAFSTLFSIVPGLEDKFNELKTKYESSKETRKNAEAMAYREAVASLGDRLKDVVDQISDDQILDMVIAKLNSAMPQPGRKLFSIRVKARFKDASWRTILEKGRALEDIMEFVKYAKWLKYEAGEAALNEIAAILEASAKAIAEEERQLIQKDS